MTSTTRIRTADDVRATVYAAANITLTLADDDGAAIMLEGPKGARVYASLSAHCHAVMMGRACAGHDAHIDALARWNATPITNANAWRTATWLLALNGGTYKAVAFDANDVVQETIAVLIETGQALTLERVMACAGEIVATLIVDADEAGQDWHTAGEMIPLEWLTDSYELELY